MSQDNPQLEDLVDFPTSWTFRAVGATTPALEAQCRAAVEKGLGREVLEVQCQPSSQGRWTSVRLRVVVESANEVRTVYAALKGVEGVIKCL